MGSSSSSAEEVREFSTDHVESEQVVCQSVRGHGRSASMVAQHFRDARREEKLPGPDPNQGPKLHRLVGLPLMPRV